MGRKLIYLDDALDRIREYCGGAVDKPTAKRILLQMDTVEYPDVPDTNVGDTISRQSAIDAVEHITSSMSVCVNSDECHGMKRMQRQAVIELANLPSAQPERKRGKWIDETFKPWGLVHHPYKCDQCGNHSEANSNFCPNCGCQMNGDEL